MNERFGTVRLSFAQDARSHFILWIHSRLERRHHDIEQLFQRQHQSHVDSQYSLASNRGLPSGKPTELWKIIIFNGKIHYKWPFSIAMLVYQRVTG